MALWSSARLVERWNPGVETMTTGRPAVPVTAPAPLAAQEGTVRIHALDWLRVLALLGVFVYHTLRPFDTDDWHIKNAEQSEIVTTLLFSFAWGLALFFLLAGAGSAMALRRRTATRYVRERLLRLGLPLLTAYLLLAPFAAFIEETYTGRYQGSFIRYVPLFFQDVWGYLTGGPDLPLGLPWTGHLWFLVFLLWFSLLGLPLLVLLRRPVGLRAISWLGDHAAHRGAVLLWAVPLGLVNAALRAPGTEEHGWGEFALFFEVFLAGAVLFADQRLISAVRRDLLPTLGVAIVGSGTVVVVMSTDLAESLDNPGSWSAAVLYFLFTGWAWAWMMLALAVGLRIPVFQRPLPTVVGAAAMPFFLVHQPVILAVAYFVVRWDTGIPVKLAAILLVSGIVSAALAVGLARVPYLSVLLGVKRRPAAVTAAR